MCLVKTSPPETLYLPRGVLSRIREKDSVQVAEAVNASLDHLRPWMRWATPAAAREDIQRETCRSKEGRWDAGSDYIYLLREREAGPVLGSFGLHRQVGSDAIEIGYWIHVDIVGRGFATAGAAALTNAAHMLPDVSQVVIRTDEANVFSGRIPHRLGYQLERVEVRPPQAPAESGRLQVWVSDCARS